MTFKVHVGVEQEGIEVPTMGPALSRLAILFPGDPLVTFDGSNWWVHSSELDAVQAAAIDLATLRPVIDETFGQINGTASLLMDLMYQPISFNGTVSVQTETGWTGFTTGKINVTPAWDNNSLHSASAKATLSAGKAVPQVATIIELLGRRDPKLAWFDLWAVWDLLGDIKGKDEVSGWINDQQAIMNFKYSANNPSGSGEAYARHGVETDQGKHLLSKGAQIMAPSDARIFISGLVRDLIEEITGIQLQLARTDR